MYFFGTLGIAPPLVTEHLFSEWRIQTSAQRYSNSSSSKKYLLDLLESSEKCFTIKRSEIRCPGLAKITFPDISSNKLLYRKTQDLRKQIINSQIGGKIPRNRLMPDNYGKIQAGLVTSSMTNTHRKVLIS